MWQWLSEQWLDIKGNFKFWILLFIGGAVVTGVKIVMRGLGYGSKSSYWGYSR